MYIETYIETYIDSTSKPKVTWKAHSNLLRTFSQKSCLQTKKNMFSSTIDWELGNVQTNSKGIRSAPLTNSDGSPGFLQLADVHSPLKAPSGSSAFNDPTAIRHNICFSLRSESGR